MFRAGCYIRARGAIMVIRTHFYVKKLHSYGGTVKVEVAPAPGMENLCILTISATPHLSWLFSIATESDDLCYGIIELTKVLPYYVCE